MYCFNRCLIFVSKSDLTGGLYSHECRYGVNLYPPVDMGYLNGIIFYHEYVYKIIIPVDTYHCHL